MEYNDTHAKIIQRETDAKLVVHLCFSNVAFVFAMYRLQQKIPLHSAHSYVLHDYLYPVFCFFFFIPISTNMHIFATFRLHHESEYNVRREVLVSDAFHNFFDSHKNCKMHVMYKHV